jgi:hypothetical protein
VTAIVAPSLTVVDGMPARSVALTRSSVPSEIRTSARQSCPLRRRSTTRPSTRTSRHSWLSDRAPDPCGAALTLPEPVVTASSAASCEAPKYVPISPLTRIRAPNAKRTSAGRRTRIAPDASWSVVRRPSASSSPGGAVTMPSTVTLPLARRASAIETSMGVPLVEPGDARAEAVGAGAAVTTRSAGSRGHSR